jgi:hypothetical protein
MKVRVHESLTLDDVVHAEHGGRGHFALRSNCAGGRYRNRAGYERN